MFINLSKENRNEKEEKLKIKLLLIIILNMDNHSFCILCGLFISTIIIFILDFQKSKKILKFEFLF